MSSKAGKTKSKRKAVDGHTSLSSSASSIASSRPKRGKAKAEQEDDMQTQTENADQHSANMDTETETTMTDNVTKGSKRKRGKADTDSATVTVTVTPKATTKATAKTKTKAKAKADVKKRTASAEETSTEEVDSEGLPVAVPAPDSEGGGSAAATVSKLKAKRGKQKKEAATVTVSEAADADADAAQGEDKDDAEDDGPAKKKKKGKTSASTQAVSEPADEHKASTSSSSSSSSSSSGLSLSGGGGGGRKPDREVSGRGSFSVVGDYATLLNQTNITGGRNNNKFYVLQLLQNQSGEYFVWTRWGRVGESGQNKLEECGDSLQSAQKSFEKKFKDKTKNSWDQRDNFVKYDNKYELVEMDENGGGDGDGDGQTDAPLGRLSKGQIEKGQTLLATLRGVLEGSSSGSVAELSARYYTLIPTVVGRQAAPAISTLLALQEKEELLKFMLRMGFDEVDKGEADLSPIDGVMALPLPKSLTEAAAGVTQAYHINSADERGVQLANKQAGNPSGTMAAALYAAIMLYTSNAIYAELNKALREEKRQQVKRYFRYLRLFLEALTTLPGQTTTLWRGISVDLSAQYAVGSTVTWWGVSSCTSDVNVAKNFMSSCGGKTSFLTVHAKTACDISGITFFPNEKESLLAPGTQLKVLSKKINGSVTEIELEEVGRAFK